MKKLATFEIDDEEHKKAKKNGVNISEVCRKAVKEANSKYDIDDVMSKYLDMKIVNYLKNTNISQLTHNIIPDTDVLKRIALVCGCDWKQVDLVWMDKKRIKTIFDLSKMT